MEKPATTTRLATASSVALFVLAMCASCSGAGGGAGGSGGADGTGGSSGSAGSAGIGGASGSAGNAGSGGAGGSGGSARTDSGGPGDAGPTDGEGRHHREASVGGDATWSGDVIDSAAVTWGEPCLYNFGTSCPFPEKQECGNHQAIDVTFPMGPQLLNATLFAGVDCSKSALNDNFNDSQMKLGSDLWMFTDDADVAGVSPSNPTSAIWWVGPLTPDGFPPAGAPTTGCINYTSALKSCE